MKNIITYRTGNYLVTEDQFNPWRVVPTRIYRVGELDIAAMTNVETREEAVLIHVKNQYKRFIKNMSVTDYITSYMQTLAELPEIH